MTGDCQRYIHQKINKYYPTLAGDEPSIDERPSLPSAKSWLTPTQIASELGFKYKTGNPNPQVVNKLLEQLGYQIKTEAGWSGTQKAIDLGLADRKPVDTNSRTQKDQLLWSEDVLTILSEHSIA